MVVKESKWMVLLAFAAIYFVWGSTYVVVLFALKEFPPFLLGSLRYIIASLILYMWTSTKGENRFTFQILKKNAIVGILTLVGGSFVVMWSEQYLLSSLAAIIISAEPFWYVILDKKQWRYYFSNFSIIAGVLIGFLGIVFLFGFNIQSSEGLSGIQLFCTILLLLGSVSWVIGSLYSKYYPSQGSNEMKVCIQLMVSGIVLLISSFLKGELRNFSFASVTITAWLYLFVLTVMGSVLTYNAYIWLLSKKPPVIVGTHAYVNPIVAVLLGIWLANEKLQINHYIALTCILVGVLLVNLPTYSKSKTLKTAK